MRAEWLLIGAVFAAFALLEMLRTGFLRKPGQRPADPVVEIVSAGALVAFTQPLVLALGVMLSAVALPGRQDALAHWPWYAQFGVILLADDLTQYGWHRLTHRVPLLFNLHRAHHEAAYMSIRVVYRNGIFYYLMMPGLWLSGLLVYLGFGAVYAAYLVLKLTVVCAAHSDVRWDQKLYRMPGLSQLMWVVERIISTPATHAAHHGKHANDGVTQYDGNFGNLLFLWDVIFGTAKITRRYPREFGLEEAQGAGAARQLLWPLVRD